MNKMRGMLLLCTGVMMMSFAVPILPAQEVGELVAAEGGAPSGPAPEADAPGFLQVVFGSGFMALLLWLTIFGAAGAAVYFCVDCSITVRPIRIMPQNLIDSVAQAMGEGDVIKALKACDDEPGPLANVLSAGFSHVEEGFEVIEEAISTAASLETEKLMQKITWLSVVGNLAPMLGLLGTVQGMIAAFATLAGGTPEVSLLAQNISQALFTTAAGLTIAVPCVALYYVFRNNANKIVLRMEALTMESIKDLRHVEVVEE
jgi:biopolymer transport protein ExbB